MNELYLKRMQSYLNEKEYQQLLNCYQQIPVRGLRTNQLSKKLFLKNCDIPLKKIDYDPDGYYVISDQKYGHHPYHHLGAFYLQEPSAMAPVNMISFSGDEWVLDLCASPGGKSGQIASRIPRGVLFSNEINKKRSQVLFSNMERLGFRNVVILNETVDRLEQEFRGLFDIIFVDAPCSGEGMMRKDEVAAEQWSKELVLECQKRDIDILTKAHHLLKKGGKLVYSTCTFSKEENEDVVQFLIQELGYKLLDEPECLKAVTKQGFIPHTLRFYPFNGPGEGQFMAALQKTTDEDCRYPKLKKTKPDKEEKIIFDFLKQNTDFDSLNLIKSGNRYYQSITDLDLTKLHVLNYGIELGEVSNQRLIPYHHFFKALGHHFKNQLVLDIKDPRVNQYIHGEEIVADVPNGFGVIIIDGLVLGGFKAVQGHLKNYYPKGLRSSILMEE